MFVSLGPFLFVGDLFVVVCVCFSIVFWLMCFSFLPGFCHCQAFFIWSVFVLVFFNFARAVFICFLIWDVLRACRFGVGFV